MVATIEIGPHKAAHTAVVIDETERVLDGLKASADRYQTARLAKWASRLDGDGRVWEGEAAQRGLVM